MSESNIMKSAMLAASKLGCKIFRVNVGRAWQGDKIIKNKDGSITIHNPRPFKTGVPKGYPDLTGFVPVTITPDMVGKKIAMFVAFETKTAVGRATPAQMNFLGAVADAGGVAGIVRSDDDVVRAINALNNSDV